VSHPELKGAVTSGVDCCNLWADAAALADRTSAVTTKSSKMHPLDLSSLSVCPSIARESLNGFLSNLVFAGLTQLFFFFPESGWYRSRKADTFLYAHMFNYLSEWKVFRTKVVKMQQTFYVPLSLNSLEML
jgi:hypothetical protein